MKYNLLPGILLLILCVINSSLSVQGQVKEEQQQVLVISSYYPLKENGNHLIASISSELAKKTDYKFSVEYMDCEASPDFSSWTEWMSQLFVAYKSSPDVVVILGNESWSAYREACIDTWKDIPVVLGAVKHGFIDYRSIKEVPISCIDSIKSMKSSFGSFHVTGYYTKDYFEENLKLIRRVEPQVDKIIFLYDNRYRHHFIRPYLQKLVRELGFKELHTLYGNELTTTQVIDSIIHTDNQYAILSGGWYTDARQYPHAYSMIHNELGRYLTKYFYQLFDQGFQSPNYMGGYFLLGSEMGSDIADLTYQVLTFGIDKCPPFQLTPTSPRYHINSKLLELLDKSPRVLPENTVLHNQKPTFFETYKRQIIFGLALLILMLVSFIVFLVQKRKQVEFYKRNSEQMKLLNNELVRLREHAEESNRLKSAFLANMSHEIRTPLNAIVGFSNLIVNTEDKAEIEEYYHIVETNNELLLQLINDILDLSKIEAGHLDFTFTDVDLVTVFKQLKQVYESRVKPRVALECCVPDERFVIRSEKNRLTQVISNFLSNAVKFTFEGSIRMGYKHCSGNKLYFYVTDTGKGIAEENQPKVFQRFMKFDNFIQGTGLGLSICEVIVKRLGGEIGVESKLGEGSTFWFTLPLS